MPLNPMSKSPPPRGLIERAERNLDELRRTSELARHQLRDLDVEADHLRGIGGVGLDKGRAALGVAAPAERRLRPERRGRRDDDQDREQPPHNRATV